MKKDNAFSGLEAAIVLIAFVVVAAVFSYVMLGAGFFATQKSQEVTYSGIKQSTSNIIVDGTLYGEMNGAGTDLWIVTYYLSIPEGGQPQKISDIEYTVTVDNTKLTYAPYVEGGVADKFSITSPDETYSTYILRPGDSVKMNLYLGVTGGTTGPTPGGSFTMEVRPSVGAASLISKTLVTGYRGGAII